MLKSLYVLFVTLLASITLPAKAFVCQPSGIDYRQAVQKSVRYFVENPELLGISGLSGSIRISVLPEDFRDITGKSYTLKQNVRKSYHNFSDELGILSDEFRFKYRTNVQCDGFSGTEADSTLKTPQFEPDVTLSKVALIALDKLTSSIDFVPRNNHSGSHSLKIYVPNQCSNNSQLYNVLIQRTNAVAGRTVSRVFRSIVNSTKGVIESQTSSPGWFLHNGENSNETAYERQGDKFIDRKNKIFWVVDSSNSSKTFEEAQAFCKSQRLSIPDLASADILFAHFSFCDRWAGEESLLCTEGQIWTDRAPGLSPRETITPKTLKTICLGKL